MKINLPVTGQERLFSADKSMVTKTNIKGIITFANKDFVEVSGYSEAELVGTSHNLIRHPDMPAVAFEVMWKTLKRGLPWRGIVKNRCKNGDHYWVDARIVPIKKNGQVMGYMSVRACPSRDDVASAQALYKIAATAPETIREDFSPGWKKHLSIKNGIPLWILFVTLMMIAGGILGITGLNMSKSAIRSLYYEEMDPVQTIGRINFLMADNRAQVALALHRTPGSSPDARQDRPVNDYMQALVKNKGEIDRLWEGYVIRITDPTEKGLADRYANARSRYVQEGLLKAKRALEANNYPQAKLIFVNNVNPFYDTANASASALLTHLSERGKAKLTDATERSRVIVNLALAGIVLSCLALVVAGIFFFRVTARPLEKAVRALEQIAEGNLSGNMDTLGYGEPGRVMAAVSVTQMHLNVMMHEIKQSSESIHRQCRNLNQTMMNLAEHSDEQHDRVYQTVDAVTHSRAEMVAIAGNLESLMQAMNGANQNSLATMAPANLQLTVFEPVLPELMAVFDESPDQFPASPGNSQSLPATPAEESVLLSARSDGNLSGQVQEIADGARVQSLAVEEVAAQLNQIAGLIVQNREDVQGAWAASQQLQQTARELEQLVKYFE